jgi:hypothetical protein
MGRLQGPPACGQQSAGAPAGGTFDAAHIEGIDGAGAGDGGGAEGRLSAVAVERLLDDDVLVRGKLYGAWLALKRYERACCVAIELSAEC